MEEDLEKLAQEKLAAAHALLDEAAELAERGKFNIEFYDGGTYYPKSVHVPPTDEEVEAYTKKNLDEDVKWEELSDDEKREFLDDGRINLEDELSESDDHWLPEYAEPGQWWQPSRNC